MVANFDPDRWSELLSNGQPEEVLDETTACLEERPDQEESVYFHALALADLGWFHDAVEELEELLDRCPEEPDVHAELAMAAFLAGGFERAATAADQALQLDEGCPLAMQVKGYLAERDGDLAEADRWIGEAHRREPVGFPAALHLTDEEFASVTNAALAELPEEFSRAIENVAIVEEPVPSDELLADLDEEGDPLMLGLYAGVSVDDASVWSAVEMPSQIYLFRRNIERAGATREEITHELRVTLFHEIGHHLGYDEEGIAEIGLA